MSCGSTAKPLKVSFDEFAEAVVARRIPRIARTRVLLRI